MSKEKRYSALEVALLLTERISENIKKNEDLIKSINTSHEIDNGDEPNNDLAECPEYLANSLSEQGSSESSEESFESSEEEYDEEGNPKKKKKEFGEEESEEHEESESPEEEYEEESEEEYDFKKSESGMHTVEYKRLAKNTFATNSGGAAEASSGFGGLLGTPPTPTPTATPTVGKAEDSEDKTKKNISIKRFESGEEEMSTAGQGEVKRTSQNPKETGKKFQDSRKKKGQWRSKKFKETGDDSYLKGTHDHLFGKSEVKETKGMETPTHPSDKEKEEKKGIKRPMEKCGDMLAAKSKK